MRLGLIPEICCEECNDIIHNHFHCPSCNRSNAGTSLFWSIYEDVDETELIIQCLSCGAEFKCVTPPNLRKGIFHGDWEWEETTKSQI